MYELRDIAFSSHVGIGAAHIADLTDRATRSR